MVAESKVELTPAQQSLASEHVKLTTYVLLRDFRSYKGRPIWDYLRAASMTGLVLAASRYDPVEFRTASGDPVGFSTYAVPTIWGTIRNQLNRIKLRKKVFFPRWADSEVGAETLAALTPIERDPSTSAEDSERAALVADALRFLHPVELTVIRLRFGLNGAPQMELSEVARQLGVSRERACQRYRSALVKLRNEIPCAALRKALVA